MKAFATFGNTAMSHYFALEKSRKGDMQYEKGDPRATMGNNLLALPIDVFEAAAPDKIGGAMVDLEDDLETVHYASGGGAGGVVAAAAVAPFVLLYRFLCGALMDVFDVAFLPVRIGKDVVDAVEVGHEVEKERSV